MTYHVDDSRRVDDMHRRHVETDRPSDTKWIIGGFVALVLAIAGLFMFSDKGDQVASNNAGNPAMTTPAQRPAPPAMR